MTLVSNNLVLVWGAVEVERGFATIPTFNRETATTRPVIRMRM